MRHKKSTPKPALNTGGLNLHLFILAANTQNLTMKNLAHAPFFSMLA
jgi:hypothetical protein